MSVRIILYACFSAALFYTQAASAFKLEEATIDDIHQGIRAGEVTCKQIVEGYVARARAYNGICTKLVTAEGAKIPAATGAIRAGAPLTFPTETIAISKVV